MSDWYYGSDDDPRGPVQLAELRRLHVAGEITPETPVWCPAKGMSPTPLRAVKLDSVPPSTSGERWHYERAGTRVGPVDETDIRRLMLNGGIDRDTLVWSPSVGAAFVRLGNTALAPSITEPPPLPADAVDNSLAWVLVAIPLVSELLEQAIGQQGTSIWSWPLATFLANVGVSFFDGKRVLRSGVSDRSIKLGLWLWLVPAYLYQRARAIKGPKHYVWAWIASFILSLTIGTGGVTSLLAGDTYLGLGVPTCDSRYQLRQVQKVFDSIAAVKAAGLASVNVTNVRELGASGDLRTCIGQVNANNAQGYGVTYTVERTADQLLTNLQLQ